MNQMAFFKGCVSLLMLFIFSACSQRKDEDLEDVAKREHRKPATKLERLQAKTKGYVFGEPLFAIGDSKEEDSNIGVNSYLWRASLDVLSSLPKEKVDPFGGIILTQWHQPKGEEKERFRAEVVIIGRQLRSVGLRVSLFRQVLKKGKWVDADVAQDTLDEMEDMILTRARDIKVQEEK